MPNKLVWEYLPEPPKEAVKGLAHTLFKEELPWHDTIARLLLQRGISSFDQAKAFFNPSLADLHDPYQMKDMDLAVERILSAIDQEQPILIYGDYDVDGTCSVAVLYLFLSAIYPHVFTYVPDRYREGYGVSTQGIDFADDNEIPLIITLDCGIKSHERVVYAHERGIDMIITDHHTPSDTLPEAVAVLNPKRADCPYPYKELCGCGIGFKLVQALCTALDLPSETAYRYLDLVALATCADIVPLTGENRILVHTGLQLINQQPSEVMQLLLASAKHPVEVRDLVFVAAPRVNAAGRMQHAEKAVRLLTGQDLDEADTLEYLNTQRKTTDEQITDEALRMIVLDREETAPATVVFSPHWHKGVIGIVASRLIETYYRPTIVFTQSGEVLAASARSVKGFNLYEALCECQDELIQFGGHTAAAGMTLHPDNYERFKQKFQEVVERTLPPALRSPKLLLSGELPLSDITYTFYRCLQRFAPFGPKNMTPIFYAHNVLAKEVRRVGKDFSHLRMILTDSNSNHDFVAVGFGLGYQESLLESGEPLTVAYQLTENSWQGRTSLELIVKAVKKMTNDE
jgi:single-stranded-DNA-specific exonuclease recJ